MIILIHTKILYEALCVRTVTFVASTFIKNSPMEYVLSWTVVIKVITKFPVCYEA